jgi:hypothetical protein
VDLIVDVVFLAVILVELLPDGYSHRLVRLGGIDNRDEPVGVLGIEALLENALNVVSGL